MAPATTEHPGEEERGGPEVKVPRSQGVKVARSQGVKVPRKVLLLLNNRSLDAVGKYSVSSPFRHHLTILYCIFHK